MNEAERYAAKILDLEARVRELEQERDGAGWRKVEPDETVICCLDCGRPYPHGLDFVLTRKQWKEIHPDYDGVLCPSCMVNRAKAVFPDAISVYGCVIRGKHYDEKDTLEAVLINLRQENADYCRTTLEHAHEINLLQAQLHAVTQSRDELAQRMLRSIPTTGTVARMQARNKELEQERGTLKAEVTGLTAERNYINDRFRDLQAHNRELEHYRSTACFHGLHEKCRKTCKFCDQSCSCPCHIALAHKSIPSGF